MLLALEGVLVNVLLHIGVAVLDDLADALFVRPADEVLGQTGILLARAAHDHDPEILLLASGPGAGRTVSDADAAADAEIGVSDDLAVYHLQSACGADLAVFDALLAPHAAIGIILGLRHADDAEVVHAHLAAVIGAAGKGHLHVEIVGEDQLVHLLRESCRVVAAEGAQPLAGTGDHVSRAGGGIAALVDLLIDPGLVDDQLQFSVDRIHILDLDAGDLNALAVGDENSAVSVLLRDLGDAQHALGSDHAAGNTDAGGRLASDLGVTESVLFQFFQIDIHTHSIIPPFRFLSRSCLC